MMLNKKIGLMIIGLNITITAASAAVIEQSNQSVAAFLQRGNYFEAGITVLDPSVQGKANTAYGGGSLANIAEYYTLPQVAVKIQATENLSLGFLYDQPFGASAAYSIGDPKVMANIGVFYQNTERTQVDINTENLTFLAGYQPDKNWNIYAGAAYQSFDMDIKLRGTGFAGRAALGAYNASLKKDNALGWIVGAAYQIPELGRKISLTYRSKIEHDLKTNEYGQSLVLAAEQKNPAAANFNVNSVTALKIPQSINLELQTALSKQLAVFGSLRWVNWKDFSIRPKQFGAISEALGRRGATPDNPKGFDLVKYADDQYAVTVGVGYKFNEKWSGNTNVAWDSGAGDPTTTLGPTNGYWGLGLGLQFSPTPQYFIAGGLKYLIIGDAEAQTAAMYGTKKSIASFKDNHAWGYGLKVGYRF